STQPICLFSTDARQVTPVLGGHIAPHQWAADSLSDPLLDINCKLAELTVWTAKEELSIRRGQRYRPHPDAERVPSRPAVPFEEPSATDLLLKAVGKARPANREVHHPACDVKRVAAAFPYPVYFHRQTVTGTHSIDSGLCAIERHP